MMKHELKKWSVVVLALLMTVSFVLPGSLASADTLVECTGGSSAVTMSAGYELYVREKFFSSGEPMVGKTVTQVGFQLWKEGSPTQDVVWQITDNTDSVVAYGVVINAASLDNIPTWHYVSIPGSVYIPVKDYSLVVGLPSQTGANYVHTSYSQMDIYTTGYGQVYHGGAWGTQLYGSGLFISNMNFRYWYENTTHADFDWSPALPESGDNITFNASNSSASSQIASYQWNFGDNSTAITSSANVSHPYQNNGDYTVTLTVTDNASLSDNVSKTVSVWQNAHLLEKYAPVLYLHNLENFSPKGIDSILMESDLMQGTDNITNRPAIADLENHDSSNSYLDMRDASSSVVPNPARFASYPNTVYGRVFTYPDEPDYIVLQYWFFYPFNTWDPNGPLGPYNHEGDWEMIAIVVNTGTEEIEQAGYARHWDGKTYFPEDIELVNGTHPKVFVGLGSHASYADDGVHNSISWFPTPFFTDITSDNGTVLSDYNIINISGIPSWIEWQGKWGQVGPESPASVTRLTAWTNPLDWVQALALAQSSSSFVIGQTGSPVNLHAYDQYGNHVGLNATGGIDLQIPGAYLYQPSDGEEEYIIIATEEDIRFEIKATDAGSFDFTVGRYIASEDKAVLASYENVAITASTNATLQVSANNTNYTMYVDGVPVSANMSPTVITNAATGIASDTATFSGNLTSLGTASSANVSFEWGLTSSYGNNTTAHLKTTTGTYSANISGLSANTTYHFRAKAEGAGTIYGSDQRFTTPLDTTPPAAVTNLLVAASTQSSLTLTWTAPGDDGGTGTASLYEIRYSTSSNISESNWASAANVTGEPTPLIAGSSQNMTVSRLSANTTYYFALKTSDEVPNWSTISNSPNGTAAAMKAETNLSQVVSTDNVTAVPVSINGVKNGFTGENITGVSIGSYSANATYYYAPPDGMEILHVRDGDSPFNNTENITHNDPSGDDWTGFSQDPAGDASPQIIVARLVPRLIGSATDSYNLTVNFGSITATTGENISQLAASVKTYKRGNAKDDGTVNIFDALFISQYLVGQKQLWQINAVNAASVNPDGDDGDKIDINDALFISQYIVGDRDSYFNWIGGLASSFMPITAGKVTTEIGTTDISPDKSIAVPITIKGIPVGSAGLGGYFLKLTFDPKVVSVDNITLGNGAFTGEPVFNIDNVKGEALLIGIHPEIPGATGDVTVAYVILKTKGRLGDSSKLDVSVIQLAGSLGDSIPAKDTDGVVNIR